MRLLPSLVALGLAVVSFPLAEASTSNQVCPVIGVCVTGTSDPTQQSCFWASDGYWTCHQLLSVSLLVPTLGSCGELLIDGSSIIYGCHDGPGWGGMGSQITLTKRPPSGGAYYSVRVETCGWLMGNLAKKCDTLYDGFSAPGP
jgi:hypothetical protein